MIRIILGILILAGAVGADDYAMAAGTTPPALIQTLVLSLAGLFLMFWGVDALKKDEKNW